MLLTVFTLSGFIKFEMLPSREEPPADPNVILAV